MDKHFKCFSNTSTARKNARYKLKLWWCQKLKDLHELLHHFEIAWHRDKKNKSLHQDFCTAQRVFDKTVKRCER